ncbi:MAG: hypothetical protein UE295_04345 [Acutalibacteraceae bacterium]|nr:hypothetical protein [Acutalibacteraceae bacterium]
MGDLLDFLFQYFSDFAINSTIMPKIIKYILVILICGFVVCSGINMGVDGSIWLGIVLAGIGLLVGIYLIAKIYRS